MNTSQSNPIRVLVADDDVYVLRCYQRAFSAASGSGGEAVLASLSDELFGPEGGGRSAARPAFDIVACSQGEDAVAKVTTAWEERRPFDAVILDIRMPPGINGLEAGKTIRKLDSDVPIVFVSGYSDVSKDELIRSVPPASRVHYFSKPLSFSDLAQEVAEIVRAAKRPAGA